MLLDFLFFWWRTYFLRSFNKILLSNMFYLLSNLLISHFASKTWCQVTAAFGIPFSMFPLTNTLIKLINWYRILWLHTSFFFQYSSSIFVVKVNNLVFSINFMSLFGWVFTTSYMHYINIVRCFWLRFTLSYI